MHRLHPIISYQDTKRKANLGKVINCVFKGLMKCILEEITVAKLVNSRLKEGL